MNTSSSATPGSSVCSIAGIVNAVRPRLISALCLASFAVGAVSLIALPVSAAQLPQPVQVQVVNSAAQPAQVEVVKPVNVQGSVETLDDALHQPFGSTAFGVATNGQNNAYLYFAIPTGKRLIIESVTVFAELPNGQKAAVTLATPMPLQTLYLTVQSQGVFNNYDYLVGTHSLKLRVESTANSTQMVFGFSRSATSDNGYFWASVSGYLIDL